MQDKNAETCKAIQCRGLHGQEGGEPRRCMRLVEVSEKCKNSTTCRRMYVKTGRGVIRRIQIKWCSHKAGGDY